MMKVIVTGANGQLGREVVKTLFSERIECACPNSKTLDITDRDNVLRFISEYKPEAVINCAGYTNVDQAETDKKQCMKVNADGVKNLADACSESGAKLLHISTDYVFSGEGSRPYETSDSTGPLNTYGVSKLKAEKIIQETMQNYFIVRTSWLIGRHGNNFVNAILKRSELSDVVRVVDDQIGSPTFVQDLAPLLCRMIKTSRYGIYHATNEGFVSWADLAEEVFALTNKETRVLRVSSEEYGAAAIRPKNSRLSKTSLDLAGFPRLSHWKSSLSKMLKD